MSLVIQNRLNELPRMTEWLHLSCRQFDCPAEVTDQLDLCLNELITNTVSYGYEDYDEHEIVLELKLEDGRVRVDMIDDGIPFNPLLVEIQPAPESLEEARLGGLGLKLVKGFTDRQQYDYRDGKNRLTLFSRDW